MPWPAGFVSLPTGSVSRPHASVLAHLLPHGAVPTARLPAAAPIEVVMADRARAVQPAVVNAAARSSYQQVVVRQALEGEPVRRFMNTEPIVVPPNLDLQHWVEDYVYRCHRKMFPVAANGRLEGVIGTCALSHYRRGEWGQYTVAEAVRPDVKPGSIPPTPTPCKRSARCSAAASAGFSSPKAITLSASSA
jgi:hypothetical protein